MGTENKYAGFYWLTKIGRSQNETYAIMKECFGSVEEAFLYDYRLGIPDVIKNDRLISSRVLDENLKSEALNQIKSAVNQKMSLCCIEDENYPMNLRAYPPRPIFFFYYGSLERLNNCEHMLGVVGSRNCSQYGKDVTSGFVKDLSGTNTAIISGLARGIDTSSHKAAVDNDIVTAAILGCGLNIVYPAENISLYKRIRDTGIIISEYPPDTAPFRSYFPARNRIIAGLSDVVLVVEAGLGSGALITADLALNAGKDILAVPNRIDVPCGSGCNALIKNGAFCCTSSSDVFFALGLDEKAMENPEMLREALNENEQIVYDAIKKNPNFTDDDILEITDLDQLVIKRCLSSLEINGFIKRVSGGGFKA